MSAAVPIAVDTLSPGFDDPVLDAQRVFRALLDVMAHPGRIVPCPALPGAHGTAGAVGLALLDFETPFWTDAAGQADGIVSYFRFHTGAPAVDLPDRAVFAFIHDPAALPSLSAFHPGQADYPERSTTLVIAVPGFDGGAAVRLRGPGIENIADLRVAGLGEGFWRDWADNNALYPCGIDVIFAGPAAIAALPRSVKAEV